MAVPAPSPGRAAPRTRGEAGRRDGSPLSHPHLSHAHTCSHTAPLPVKASLLLRPTRPAGMRSPAPRPGMPFTPWLRLLLLHRCRKVTPDGREQMVPCHKCHPGIVAWAALARLSDLMVGKAVLPGFSCPNPSFPSTALPCLPALPLACPDPGKVVPSPFHNSDQSGGHCPPCSVEQRVPQCPERVRLGGGVPLAPGAGRDTGWPGCQAIPGRGRARRAGTGRSVWASRLARISSPHPRARRGPA